jgi:hypothetical protein
MLLASCIMCPVTSLRPPALFVLAVLSTSCAYDWTVGARGTGSDATSDSTLVDSSSGIDSAPTDTSVVADTAANCGALLIALEDARRASKKCVSTAGACAKTVTNECGCASSVGDDTKPEAGAFRDAVKAFLDAGC